MLTRRHLVTAAAAVPFTNALQPASAQGPARATGAWHRGPEAPYAVQEIYPVLHRGGIWIVGGMSPQAGGATERVIIFDIQAQQWRDGPALPMPTHHVQLASLGDDLYAIGGYLGGATRRQWNCTTRVLKLVGERWTEGPALPKPIAESMALVHAGRIHLIGGRSPRGASNASWGDQTDVADHFVFANGAWSRAAALPMARNSHGGAVVGEQLHIVSGRTVASGQTPAHHIYEPRTDSWREGTAFPEARGGLACATWRGRLIAGGGEIFSPGSVGSALYALDGNAWSSIATLPTPRHGHGLVAAADALYALGGAPQPSDNGTLASLDILR